MTIEWDDEELQKALAHIEEVLPERLEECVEKACLAIEAEAKERCPVRDGTLRRSIMTEVGKKDDKVVGQVGTNLEYAPYIHEGTGIYARAGNGRKEVPWVYYDEKTDKFYSTKGIKPCPFLQEACNKVSPRLTDYFKGVLEGNA